MATETKLESTTSIQSLIDTVGPHATKVMLGAAAVGLIAAFLPAVAVTISVFGSTTTESLAVWRDWRGKLDLLAYIAVGVMAGWTLRKPDRPVKKLALACLITAGVALLLAAWLPLSISGNTGVAKELASISIGLGCYVNVLAALALAVGAALQAKRADVF